MNMDFAVESSIDDLRISGGRGLLLFHLPLQRQVGLQVCQRSEGKPDPAAQGGNKGTVDIAQVSLPYLVAQTRSRFREPMPDPTDRSSDNPGDLLVVVTFKIVQDKDISLLD